jgi:hypothetical protein
VLLPSVDGWLRRSARLQAESRTIKGRGARHGGIAFRHACRLMLTCNPRRVRDPGERASA